MILGVDCTAFNISLYMPSTLKVRSDIITPTMTNKEVDCTKSILGVRGTVPKCKYGKRNNYFSIL